MCVTIRCGVVSGHIWLPSEGCWLASVLESTSSTAVHTSVERSHSDAGTRAYHSSKFQSLNPMGTKAVVVHLSLHVPCGNSPPSSLMHVADVDLGRVQHELADLQHNIRSAKQEAGCWLVGRVHANSPCFHFRCPGGLTPRQRMHTPLPARVSACPL